MAYLQLHDGPAARAPVPVEELYVRVPDGQGGFQLIREDVFDDLPDDQWDAIMAYDEEFGMHGIFSNMRARRQDRKQKRQERKDLKAQSKATARIQRTSGGGILAKVGNAVSNVMQSIRGEAPADPAMDPRLQIEYQNGQFNAQVGDKQWYQRPEIIIPGVIVLGAGIYMLTKNRR